MGMHNFCSIAKIPSFSGRQFAVGIKGKYWEPGQTIVIGFIGGTAAERDFVKKTALKWLKFANLKFVFDPAILSDAHVRISFNKGSGSWSYIGTDCLNIPASRATINFGWLDEAVVLHESGHMLGLGHEHQNPNKPINWDKPQVYSDLSQAPNYWDRITIDHNIFDQYGLGAVDSSPLDSSSIMLYQIPVRWTTDGFFASFNTKISPTDASFIMRLYPGLPKMDGKLQLQQIFLETKDLSRLSESVLVRMGQSLGVATNADELRRSENLRLVASALDLN